MTVGLLRLADEIFGSIKIDGVDHASIKMSSLRDKIALIPQEATMFAGDIRLNLDPLQASTDAELAECEIRAPRCVAQEYIQRPVVGWFCVVLG